MSAMKKTTAAILAVLIAAVTLSLAATPSASAAGPLEFAVLGSDGGGSGGAECPSGSIEDNEGKCRKPVADAVTCPKGALGAPGACYIYVDKVMTKTDAKACPLGSVEDSHGKCRKPVANAVTCPEGALGVPGACYIYVNKVMPKILKAN